MTLTALSVRQPYADLIAEGKKTIELRNWYTPYRGPLVIVSSKSTENLGRGDSTERLGIVCGFVYLARCDPYSSDRHDKHAMCSLGMDGEGFAWIFKDNIYIKTENSIQVKGKAGLYKLSVKLIGNDIEGGPVLRKCSCGEHEPCPDCFGTEKEFYIVWSRKKGGV